MQHKEFNNEYLKCLSEKLIGENKELGDFHIDLLKCGSNKNVSKFRDIIYSINLRPNTASPTRLTSRTQIFIDNVFKGNHPKVLQKHCCRMHV